MEVYICTALQLYLLHSMLDQEMYHYNWNPTFNESGKYVLALLNTTSMLYSSC